MGRRVRLALGVALVAQSAAASDVDQHLRAGATHFRAGRFPEAVVEFKVARELGAGSECPWYVAAALTRAGRLPEALEAFEVAAQTAPESADALFLYYRGVACSGSQLVVCAADAFEAASKASGPKVAEQARHLALEARALLSREPPRSAIDELVSRGRVALAAGHPLLARVLSREALAMAARRADHFGEAEASKLDAALDAGAP
jgi:tetratricopeptide (TPR) repeat protein